MASATARFMTFATGSKNYSFSVYSVGTSNYVWVNSNGTVSWGPCLLNPDGTPKTDSSGNGIPDPTKMKTWMNGNGQTGGTKPPSGSIAE
jgi:hypothetical protein